MAKFHYVDPEDTTRDPFAPEQDAESDFEKLLNSEAAPTGARRFRMGEQVSGEVVRVGTEFVFIELGGKNTGSMASDEFTAGGLPMPKLGDTVEAYVRQDSGSEIILTRTLRRGEVDSTLLQQAHESNLPVEAKIEKVTKGGFEATLSGKRAFIPFSQMELGRIVDENAYIGQVLKFHISEFKQGGRNIVLSRKQLLREERESKQSEILNTLEVGQTLRATITRTATFGAFADIGGIEGLIPISELAWKRLKSPDEVVKIGDVVQVRVLKIEHVPKLRIALSAKNAGEDPWMGIASRLMPGTVLDGEVTRLSDFGAFVSVAEGVEGLVHISQLAWDKRVAHPRDIVSTGQAVKVHVLNVELADHKLSLSIKGPMPEEMQTRLKHKREGTTALTEEEKAQMTEWENFRKAAVAKPTAEQANVFAAAFAKAGRRKS